ncbi:MAG: PLP-dependent aspartate aminotransferase family protein, partial [Deinococcales bacterium]
MSQKPLKLETLAVHAGTQVDPASKAVIPGIFLSTTYEREIDGSYATPFVYSRIDNPNRHSLEEALAALEGAKHCASFSSGMAAIHTLFSCLKAGDHVVITDDLYHGTRHVLNKVMQRWQLSASYVDMTDLNKVTSAIQDNTSLIYTETPTNPLLKIADIAELGKIAKAHQLMLAVDSTWTTPIIQRPLTLGADVVIHSTTKYLGGHSDILGGALLLNDDYLLTKVRELQMLGGAVPSPFECWLLHRSLRSLPYRMRGHCENASQIASALAQDKRIQRVHYPGL